MVTREELVGSAQIAANIQEVVETILQECIWCIFVSQFAEENLEVIKAVPHECVPQHIVEQTTDVPVLEILEETRVPKFQAETL